MGGGGGSAAWHSPCPPRARPPAGAAAAAAGRAASVRSGGAWWAPAQSAGVSGTRRLSSHRVPCAARVGASGWEAPLARRPGGGFCGARPRRPSLPSEAVDGGSVVRGVAQVPPSSPALHPGAVPPSRASCPGPETGLSARGAGGRGSGLRGHGGDAPEVLKVGQGSGVRVGGGEVWGCATARRLSRAEGVASGRAQMSREVPRTSARRRPRWLPAACGAISPRSLSPARLRLAAAELGGQSAVKGQPRRAGSERGGAGRCAPRGGDGRGGSCAVGGLPR